MTEPIRLAAVDDIPTDTGLLVDSSVSGTSDDLALFRDGDEVFALDDTCTHSLASLAEGFVSDGKVECPLHAAEFCLRDGKALSLPATIDVATHKVEVRDGEVFLVED
ncbi:non-heme iron oxygenase ferredoxin subunit [Nocardioides sp. Kera G14]|uniref:non-heme iron oxygenase ferredoxin subunit n=1 Tax=Nocardioides sp. Kera G14 TaxID=2884264 RepID=UPI001D10BE7D|nr:non-heme iron oxygenase ferredoxin subunit [Nocardioides sp. Kera G14]UDY23667.1 non-heme iron oxygenase ferredoxin subunit [Nocardioides sp. Kera G14]